MWHREPVFGLVMSLNVLPVFKPLVFKMGVDNRINDFFIWGHKKIFMNSVAAGILKPVIF